MNSRSTLRETMERQGRRHDWVAAMVGMSKTEFSHVVAGRRKVNLEQAVKIAAVLGVPVSFVFEFPIGNNSVPVGEKDEKGLAA